MKAYILLLSFSLLASVSALGQRTSPGFHYGAKTGISIVPFFGANARSGQGAELGWFLSVRLAGDHEFQAELTGGTIGNLPIAVLEKSVYVGPEVVRQESAIQSISQFSYVDFSFLYSAKWMSYKGFSLAAGAKITRVLSTDARLNAENQLHSVGQGVSTDSFNDDALLEFERILIGGGTGSRSVTGPAFGTPSGEWVPALLAQVNKEFSSGHSLFLRASFDLQTRFTATSTALGRKLNTYQLGFQYTIK